MYTSRVTVLPVVSTVSASGWVPGWVYGWGIRVGNTGVVHPATLHRARTVPVQRSGPGRPAGPGVVVLGLGRVSWGDGGGDGPGTTLRARSVPCGTLPVPGPRRMPPPGHIGRDYGHISIKLVKTVKCHQKVCKRPAIVPIFKNGSRKSPLDFLRFPDLVAFSHKELMVPF